jgi:hypothetical protein
MPRSGAKKQISKKKDPKEIENELFYVVLNYI